MKHILSKHKNYLVSTQIIFTSPDLEHGDPHDGQAKQQGDMQVHCSANNDNGFTYYPSFSFLMKSLRKLSYFISIVMNST